MSNNHLAQRPKFSVAIQSDTYKKLINNTLQDPSAPSGLSHPSAPPWQLIPLYRSVIPAQSSLVPYWARV